MELEKILSAGIDIGTSTTQLVFSRITLQNMGGFGKIPQIKIISKEIIYKSEIYFTPLSSREEIDGKAVNQIIKTEYKKAGIAPRDLSTGAVIITGETSRKRNAAQVTNAISEIAGDFVVATAGADLESILAGKGSGAGEISKKKRKIVANLDIGGGTTNICVFENGAILDTACLDIGGRLVKIADNKITYVAPKIRQVSKNLHLDIAEGRPVNIADLRKLTDWMANILAQAVMLRLSEPDLEIMKTNRLLTIEQAPDILTFSGGVASCMENESDLFQYGDIGILLAKSIQENEFLQKAELGHAKETLRATVIGAGNYSMNISGSTIEYTTNAFPIKNIPVIKLPLEQDMDIKNLGHRFHKAIQLFTEERGSRQIAIAMKGLKAPSFLQIQEIAENIYTQFLKECTSGEHLILVLEEDMGKALGQALHHRLKDTRSIICIDGIHCDSGDFIDLGKPVVSGNVIPVIVKTLIFNQQEG